MEVLGFSWELSWDILVLHSYLLLGLQVTIQPWNHGQTHTTCLRPKLFTAS